jgi:hypothetical protein
MVIPIPLPVLRGELENRWPYTITAMVDQPPISVVELTPLSFGLDQEKIFRKKIFRKNL